MATPFKVSGLLPAWTELGLLKAQQAQLADQLSAYDQLQAKLERVPDLSQAHVMVPKAALVQATSTKPSSSAPQAAAAAAVSAGAAGPTPGGDGGGGESDKVRITAQEAFDLTKSAQTAIRSKLAELESAIGRAAQSAEAETPEQAGLDKDWTINQDGEVVNEEGLPMFDIHEELPALPEPPKIQEAKVAPATDAVQPKTRYLIKKGGKQTFGSIKPAPAPLSEDYKMSATAQALLDELEAEEAEEEAKRVAQLAAEAKAPAEAVAKAAEETLGAGAQSGKAEKKEGGAPNASEKGKGKETVQEVEAEALALSARRPVAAPAVAASQRAVDGTGEGRAPRKKAPAGFAAGFLNKKTKAKLAGLPAPASSATSPETSDAAPPTPAPAPATTSDSPPSSPRHEPLHHVLPPPTPIYKPTPPPSAPASRAASPKPPRKSVAFDPSVPEPVHKSPKPKRAPIILPAPPGMAGGEDGKPAVPPAPPAKFERPTKEAVVEREVKAPTAPRARDNLTSGGGGGEKKARAGRDKVLNTMGFAPRAEGQAPRGQIIERSTRAPEPMPSASSSTAGPVPAAASPSMADKLEASGPIHTLSLSAAAAAKPFSEQGTMSVHDIDDDQHDDDDDDDDDDDEDTEDEDSEAFYGSDSDESVDIDAALHAREIALEYHRQRMNVGAGAGTGPLGGFADPESFDAWNQPDVPLDATLQGREPSHGNASRFRTGRLESTQMIIPSLLQDQVVPSLDADAAGQEDDMAPGEREALRRALEALASHEGGARVELLEETKRRAVEEARAREEGRRAVPEVREARRPPEVKAAAAAGGKPAATAIAVPSNFGVGGSAPAPEPEAEAVVEEQAPVAVAPTLPGAAPGKKMSRFKARQLGLDV